MAISLYIVGAGGLGRDALDYARTLGRDHVDGAPLEVAGFLDDRPDALAGFAVDAGVVGTVATARPGPDDRYLIAIGDPVPRWRLAGILAARGARFATLVHPLAYLSRSAQVGPGCIVAPFAFMGPHSRLGSHVVLNTHVAVGHDTQVETCGVASPHVALSGNVVCEAGVFLGTQAAVAPGKRIGAWARIGAGAVALADVGPGVLAIGTPARGQLKYAAPTDPGPPS